MTQVMHPEEGTLDDALIGQGEILLGLDAARKRDAIAALAAAAAARRGLAEDEVLRALLAREALGATAIGRGVGLPHARMPGDFAPLGLFARLQRPLDWGARDEEPVDLLILMLWPEGSGDGFLPALSGICAGLRDGRTLRRLRTATTLEEAAAALADSRAAGP
ncbi:PTS sugar transporter subunit IIA [Roseococcus sp. DSY-14]|uniref:PTS sugar transporter subunit IIA n=1 Tax=Roseococcus sp. DSY-14 TaxID=3369650 RepID=UPI00387A9061